MVRPDCRTFWVEWACRSVVLPFGRMRRAVRLNLGLFRRRHRAVSRRPPYHAISPAVGSAEAWTANTRKINRTVVVSVVPDTVARISDGQVPGRSHSFTNSRPPFVTLRTTLIGRSDQRSMGTFAVPLALTGSDSLADGQRSSLGSGKFIALSTTFSCDAFRYCIEVRPVDALPATPVRMHI